MQPAGLPTPHPLTEQHVLACAPAGGAAAGPGRRCAQPRHHLLQQRRLHRRRRPRAPRGGPGQHEVHREHIQGARCAWCHACMHLRRACPALPTARLQHAALHCISRLGACCCTGGRQPHSQMGLQALPMGIWGAPGPTSAAGWLVLLQGECPEELDPGRPGAPVRPPLLLLLVLLPPPLLPPLHLRAGIAHLPSAAPPHRVRSFGTAACVLPLPSLHADLAIPCCRTPTHHMRRGCCLPPPCKAAERTCR